MKTARIAEANRAVGDILNASSSVRHGAKRSGSRDSASDPIPIQGCQFTLASARAKRGSGQECIKCHEPGQGGGLGLKIDRDHTRGT